MAQIHISADYGDAVAAEGLRLKGITYDPRNNLLEVGCENLDHLIMGPRAVFLVEDGERLESIEVEQQDGTVQQVNLKKKPRLLWDMRILLKI